MANGLSAYRTKESVSELMTGTRTFAYHNDLDIATSTIINVSVVKDLIGEKRVLT